MVADIDGFLPDSAFLLDVPRHRLERCHPACRQRTGGGWFHHDAYTDQMIETVEKMGPYIVIAPGLALAHSRPSEAVLKTGLSWVRLSTPVKFGNKANDPVSLVIGLAGHDENEHITVMLRHRLGPDQSQEDRGARQGPHAGSHPRTSCINSRAAQPGPAAGERHTHTSITESNN